MRKCPRLVSGARISHDRSAAPAERDRAARQAARQRRRVVDLQPRLRDPAAVAERVGHAHPVADVAVQLAHRVAGLEVGQAEPDEHVRPADHEDHEVEQVEEERLARSRRQRTTRIVARMIAWSRRSIARSRCESAGRRALGGRSGLDGRGGPDLGRAPTGRADAVDRPSNRGSRARPGPAWTSWIDELVLMIRRWASAGSARDLMSSGIT